VQQVWVVVEVSVVMLGLALSICKRHSSTVIIKVDVIIITLITTAEICTSNKIQKAMLTGNVDRCTAAPVKVIIVTSLPKIRDRD